MHIRLLSRLLEMAYGKAQLVTWVQGQIDNIVQNYILLHIAKHAPVYDTMPEHIPHWENELMTAMSIIIGKESSCSRSAIAKGVKYLFCNSEELNHNADVIRRKTWAKMKKEHVDQKSSAYLNAVASFMAVVPRISELVSATEPQDIEDFVISI